MLNDIYVLRSSIALNYQSLSENEGVMDFFKTNIRESVRLKTTHNFYDLLTLFDGKKSLREIIKESVYTRENIEKLVSFLHSKNILIKIDSIYPKDIIGQNYRLINFLEEYCFSTSEVLKKLNLLNKSFVFIVGLGAVGTYIVDILARSGVRNFILVDNDKVELSNLHRQNLYFESDVGKYKLDCVEERLKEISKDISVKKIYKIFDESFFERFDDDFSLAINCADFPNVDITTQILAKECMKRNVPHIVGGGYNLHLTLIGQSILPFETACYECFNVELEKINGNFTNIKKLIRKNRKIGSFTPLCTMSASLSALDAIKILCKFYTRLTNTSARIEFKTRNMDIQRIQIPRNPICKICGKKEIL